MGRYAEARNPILIEGKKYKIENNDGVLLHSGLSGWNKKWKVINAIKIKVFLLNTCVKMGQVDSLVI